MGSGSEKGSMRGCFLFLLLQTSPIPGSTMTREPEWSGLEITDPIATRRPSRPLEDLENLIDRFPFHDDHNIGCSGCSDPKDGSSTTGISDHSTDGIGTSLPAPCPTLFPLQATKFEKPEENGLLSAR